MVPASACLPGAVRVRAVLLRRRGGGRTGAWATRGEPHVGLAWAAMPAGMRSRLAAWPAMVKIGIHRFVIVLRGFV